MNTGASVRLDLAGLADGEPVQVDLAGRLVCVVRSGDRVHAVDDTCTHAEVSLSEGEVEDGTIECWLHGSRFDLVTGEPSGPPAIVPLTVHRVEQDGSTVTVTLAGAAGGTAAAPTTADNA